MKTDICVVQIDGVTYYELRVNLGDNNFMIYRLTEVEAKTLKDQLKSALPKSGE